MQKNNNNTTLMHWHSFSPRRAHWVKTGLSLFFRHGPFKPPSWKSCSVLIGQTHQALADCKTPNRCVGGKNWHYQTHFQKREPHVHMALWRPSRCSDGRVFHPIQTKPAFTEAGTEYRLVRNTVLCWNVYIRVSNRIKSVYLIICIAPSKV